MYYVGLSHPRRRWRSMSRCGNKAKEKVFTKRYLHRAQSLD
ncbi:CGNR zinc finger domain-containing protein [Leisingera sp. M527]|nr:CGNR zinc finger domain-containing protein [Leisingera sp. M527]